MFELSTFIYRIHYSEDLLALVSRQNGWRHGINIWYHSNDSIIMLRHWFNGKPHGINIWRYSDGAYYVYHTHRGIQYGINIHYRLNGAIMTETQYRAVHPRIHRFSQSISKIPNWYNSAKLK